MRILVDTHCWLWALARPEALNADAAALLRDGETEVVFSSVSVWEIAIKTALGKLRVSQANGKSLLEMIDSQPVTPLPVLHSHAREVAGLPPHHRDPFDRLLIAQAKIENLPIMTGDDQFVPYEIDIIWAALRPPPKTTNDTPPIASDS